MAIVLPDLSAIGAQRYVLGVANRLSRFNIEYRILLQCSIGEFSSEVPEELRQSFASRTFARIRGIRTIESLGRLLVLLRRGNFDYVFCVTPFLNRAACLFKYLGLVKSKLIIEEHGYPPRYLHKDDGMSRCWVWFYEKTFWLYQSASKIRVISTGIRDYYSDRGLKDNVLLFPNLIDLRRIADLSARPPSHHLSGDAPNILYFGRLTAQKNVAFLIEAFAFLVKRRDAYLIVVGKGDEETLLKDIVLRRDIDDRVKFIGFVENPYPLIRAADVMALTSVWEGAPQVLVEAMAVGTAVVARDCPTGPSEMLGDKSERGWLVPYEAGPEEFSVALERALDNPNERARRASAARKFAFQEYDIDRRLGEQAALFFD